MKTRENTKVSHNRSAGQKLQTGSSGDLMKGSSPECCCDQESGDRHACHAIASDMSHMSPQTPVRAAFTKARWHYSLSNSGNLMKGGTMEIFSMVNDLNS